MNLTPKEAVTALRQAQEALRQSSLINRAEVRRKLIQQAQDTRYYWQQFEPRVSEDTLSKIEASVSAHIRSIVEKLPSKGKTIILCGSLFLMMAVGC